MKNTNLKKRLILGALFLSLIVLMENTANLYGFISNLLGNEKLIAMYFMGVSAEVAIFICIYSGSRTAGILFAVLSWFVGITFHNWNDPIFAYQSSSWLDITFIPHKKFFASFLLQTINSAIVWYLSELYVKMEQVTSTNEQLQRLNAIVTATEQRKDNLGRACVELVRRRDDYKTDVNEAISKLEVLKSEGERILQTHKDEETKLQRRVEELRKTALSLQNSNNKRSSNKKIKEA